ncbi:MAG TPA: alkaline phosphatase family protein [Elusimicrobiales bacterium]|nr:alkaline phosphatase family protein [Elusimicrobiales bacterium]
MARTARLSSLAACLLFFYSGLAPARAEKKLYWFVPDGLRGAGGEFDVFRLAREGRLPNIKKMMDEGSYGYSVPVYPSHTPANFAALMTGAYPEVNGVPDGPMRVEGYPLAKPSVTGFSSAAKKIPPMWKILEGSGRRTVVLSVPGSTPPEIDYGTVIRGRWANWGADLYAVNFESLLPASQRAARGNDNRLFQLGAELTKYPSLVPAAGWRLPLKSYSPPLEMPLLAHGATVYACLADSSDDGKTSYDSVVFSADKTAPLAELRRSGEWTDWLPVKLGWNGLEVDSRMRLALIRVGPEGFLKVRAYYDLLNPTVVQPADAYEKLYAYAGPMADFPDNWPAQLNNYPEEKEIFRAEAMMTLDWHRKAARYFLAEDRPGAFIHDLYTPNQMLESRWWLPYLDPASDRYNATDEAGRAVLRAEVLAMYEGIDAILGEALAAAGPESVIVLSSDHGVIPLNKKVLVNNLFAAAGLLKFSIAPVTGEADIDWAASKAAHLKMHGIYLHPGGLAGPWRRGAGPEYEALRDKITALLSGLRDGETAPFLEVLKREDAAAKYHLPPDRIADLVLVMRPGYGLTEDMTEGLEVFRPAVEGGYKQALVSTEVPGMWTPFLVMGPGVKKNHRIAVNLSNIDQAPTILKILGLEKPGYMQGRSADEVLDAAAGK